MRHLASGLRRQVPVPVQGASISTRSIAAVQVGEQIGCLCRLRGADLDVARAGALEPRVDRREAALVEIGRVDLAALLHHGRERQRLAAGAGAEIDHLLAGLGAAQQRGELRAFVLHFDHALEKRRLGMDRRAFGVRRPSRCAGRPATSASASTSRCASASRRLVAVRLEGVDPQVERRARASAAPSAARSSPNTRARYGSSHSG